MATKTGTNGANTINGTNSADTIWGRGGDDTLSGLGGIDKLYGEAGNDILKGGLGSDRLDGGSGIDRITYFNDGSTQGVSVDLTQGRATQGSQIDTLVSVEDVFGSLFSDVIFGNGGANKLSGSNGDDQLFGRAGDDFFHGGSGNDYVDGGDGLRDKISYESLSAGSGISANLQDGVIYTDGFNGTDTVRAVEDVDGSNFGDYINGNAAANSLAGLAGDDSVYGYAGNDRLYGGLGADYLAGNEGNDQLFGVDGNDTLNGGAGNDVMRGATGADTFEMSYYGGDVGRDTIEDFTRGQDKLNVEIYSDYAYLGSFASLDSNWSGALDDGDDCVRVESVTYNGSTRMSTVIDVTNAISEPGELSLVIFSVTGITAGDFLYG